MALILEELQPLAVPLHHLEGLPGNPRRGDVDAVMRSYTVFGQRKPVVARRVGSADDGRPTGVVIAGNHQLEDQITIWRAVPPNRLMVKGRDDQTDHPTQKPIALWTKPIANHVPPGGVVYDAFAGSGSAVIAAYRLGRVALAMELTPSWCDVICRRFQEHTGEKPVLEATGGPVDFTVEAAAV